MAGVSATVFCDKCKSYKIINLILPNDKIQCSKCNIIKFCSKCYGEENHETVCQRICVLEKDIQDLQDKVDPETDIEQFAKFIRKKMDYAYCIWHLAEKYFSPRLYKLFFDHAIKLIKVKANSNNQMVLYNNQILGSTSLISNICMALVYLDRPRDAVQTILYHLQMYDKRIEVKTDIEKLKDGDWLRIRTPNIITKSSFNFNEYDPKRHGPILVILLPCLIKIISLQLEEKRRPYELLQALISNQKETIDYYKEKFPKLKETNVVDRDRIFEAISGKKEDTFDIIIEDAKKLFKNVFNICKLCYRNLEVIFTNHDSKNMEIVLQWFISTDISHQSEKLAAKSTVPFFLRLVNGQMTLHPECKQFFDSFVKQDNLNAPRLNKPCPASKKPRMFTCNSDQSSQCITNNKENSPKLFVTIPNHFVFDSDKKLFKTEIKEELTKQETI